MPKLVRCRLQIFAVMLTAALGCSGLTDPRLWRGNLMERNLADGRCYRMVALSLEGWEAYDRNPIKGSGDSCILKAEATF